MPDITIVTFNLLNKPSRWEERRDLIAGELARLQPDIICLQEVSLPRNNAQWVADQLGGYAVVLTPFTGRRSHKQAIAILSRLPVLETWSLDLIKQQRVAQGALVDLHGRPVLVVNGHYYWHIVDNAYHMLQVKRVFDWLDTVDRKDATIMCGDFNGTPDYRSIQMIRRRFQSAYALRHGREPDYTCPTPFRYRFSPVRNTLSRLGNLAKTGSLDLWRGTIDYIFVDQPLAVLDARIVLDQPAPHDETIYPSDHVGLLAHLSIPQPP